MPDAILTPRQQEVYDFIRDFTARNGFAPTVRDIGAAFGIRSQNGVMCHLKALERKGVITRSRYLSRSIRVVGDDPAQRLHDSIMGLRPDNEDMAYEAGFCDARHAAAELVLGANQ